jgi:hypothetical protein
MKVYEIKPDKGCNAHTEDNFNNMIESVKEWLNEADAGTELTVKVLEMTGSEYLALPEYDGP